MFKEKCDNYFSCHAYKDKYYASSDEERANAINTARIDLASCGVQLTGENDPEILLAALFEQTLFVLVSSGGNETTEKRRLLSESIEGIGSCHYMPGKAPGYISEKAFQLVDSFYRNCRTIRRG